MNVVQKIRTIRKLKSQTVIILYYNKMQETRKIKTCSYWALMFLVIVKGGPWNIFGEGVENIFPSLFCLRTTKRYPEQLGLLLLGQK